VVTERSPRETMDGRDHRAELAFLDRLFTSSPLGLGFLDRDLRFVRVNQRLAETNGFLPGARVGNRLSDLSPAIDVGRLTESGRRILETGEAMLDVEISGERAAAPGKLRHWMVDWNPVEVDGQRIGISMLVREVTVEREATAALSRSEERQRIVQNNANLRMWDWAPGEGSESFVTELRLVDDAGAVTSITLEEWRACVHPEDLARIDSELAAAVGARREFDVEFRYLGGRGDLRWIAAKGAALYDDAGRIVRALGVNVDVTARMHAEQALRESERRFARLSDTGIVGIVIADVHGSILEGNDAYLKMIGYSREEVLAGRVRWADLMPPEFTGTRPSRP
jgi:PAS domain S-box-containing protein